MDADDEGGGTAAELRRLREDQQRARSRAVMWLVVLAFVAAVAFTMWRTEQDAKGYGECLRDLRTPVEQC